MFYRVSAIHTFQFSILFRLIHIVQFQVQRFDRKKNPICLFVCSLASRRNLGFLFSICSNANFLLVSCGLQTNIQLLQLQSFHCNVFVRSLLINYNKLFTKKKTSQRLLRAQLESFFWLKSTFTQNQLHPKRSFRFFNRDLKAQSRAYNIQFHELCHLVVRAKVMFQG